MDTNNTDNTEYMDIGAAVAHRQKLEMSAEENNRNIVLAVLKRIGVTKVRLLYYGGGDSGQIEDVEFDGLLDDPLKIPVKEIFRVVGTEYGEFGWRATESTREGNNVRTMVEDYFYDWLGACEHDITNNDGGCATMLIYPMTGDIEVHVSVNYMSTDDYSYNL